MQKADNILKGLGFCYQSLSEVAHDLLTAEEFGETVYKQFQEERIEKGDPHFHDSLHKQKLKTFSDVKKPKIAKGANKDAIIKADHKLFGHTLFVATSSKLDMSSVLAHTFGPLPWSLGNCDDTQKKTSKAALAQKLEFL